ncbi:hypothetical protein BT93_L4680 [Corymbia citriodora subsp. variegata]|uniref:Enoyl reductase (ER) domain-containing protein n=1 Tax=Corymbia citriodora subsp. variegata TaxID=360336 RepID=A0A8T0CXI5_CORYI|nr:hypothetical protein BT93_L4680 [Corymbia citriodora subsp. variegata]
MGSGSEEINTAKMTTVESKEWHIQAYAPEGIPTSDHLKMRTTRIPVDAGSIPDLHVAIEMLFISVEPFVRSRMTGREDGLYSPQFDLNQVVTAFGIGRVVESTDDKYAKGEIVTSPFLPVAEYAVVPSDFIIKRIEPDGGVELPDYLSCLGVPGFAAWVGIEVIGEPKAGSNVFISAAAGGVGMCAGQLAKLRGCKVVGSTGSDEKVIMVKEEFGYDEAFNYKKETDLDSALSKYFPEGIDMYLDNVGGKMLEAVLNHVNEGARISLCGMISGYNKVWTEREGVRNLLNMVGKGVRMEGFMVGSPSHLARFGDFAREMEGHLRQGRIRSKLKIYHGVESFLESLQSLFSSANMGKVIIQVKPL